MFRFLIVFSENTIIYVKYCALSALSDECMVDMKVKVFKLICFILVLTVTAGLALPALADEKAGAQSPGEIHIGTEQDYLDFVDSCRLDTWSVGKRIILDNDISLTKPVAPAATFSGSFYGMGHTISNVKLEGKHSRAGLFGIIESEGMVKGLHVSGNLKPEGKVLASGGIAGINRGRIIDSSFDGTVSCNTVSGGIAGNNAGIINKCSVSGSISGLESAGGICAYNEGKILKCTNGADVNIKVTDEGVTVKAVLNELKQGGLAEKIDTVLNLKQINSSSNIGGIAGYSMGCIENCVNTGTVGREGNGFNVGGICGCNCGWIVTSNNSAPVRGNEYVGGIVGLAEPALAVVKGGDLIEPVRAEIDNLLDIINDFTYDLEICADDITLKIDGLAKSLSGVTDNLTVFERELAGLINDKIYEVNEVKHAVGSAAGKIGTAVDDIKNLGGGVSNVIVYTADVLNVPNKVLPHYTDSTQNKHDGTYIEWTDETRVEWKQSADCWSGHYGIPLWDPDEDPEAEAFLLDFNAAVLSDINKETLEISDNIKNIANGIHDAVNEIACIQDMSDFAYIKDSFNNGFASVMTSMSKTMDQVSELTKSVNDFLKLITSTIRAVTGEIAVAADGILDSVYDFSTGKFSLKRYYYGTDEYRKSELTGNGIISGCVNTADVKGIQYVGGIAGSQSLNGTPDIITKNSNGITIISLCYTDLIQHCRNTGNIVAQQNYVGMVAGSQSLGAIYDCEGYGSAQSREGSYAGGIAGYTESVIDASFAKGTIRANDYAGGVAGSGAAETSVSGSKILSCVSQVEVLSKGQFIGGISGTEAGEFEENYFINPELNGIDDYSLAGKAEPAPDEGVKTPDDFSSTEVLKAKDLDSVKGRAPSKPLSVKKLLALWGAAIIVLLILISIVIKYAVFFMVKKIRDESKSASQDN